MFYSEIAERLTAWFESVIAPDAAADYDASDDERKRWRYTPALLRINHTVCVCGNGKVRVELNVGVKNASGKGGGVKRATTWEPRMRRLCPTWSRRPYEKREKRINRRSIC